MKYGARTIGALAVGLGCSRAPSPPAAPPTVDAGPTEALRPIPGREVVAPAAETLTIEERLRRCDPSARGAVVRVADDVAYVAETGPAGTVVRLVRRAAGSEFRCDRYAATAAAPRVAWPDGGAVTVASATDVPRAALLEVDASGVVRSVAMIDAACSAGATLQALRLFPGRPSLLLRCWTPSAEHWSATDRVFDRTEQAWEPLVTSESGRIVRTPTMSAPPPDAALPGSIRVLVAGASPRLDVTTSSHDRIAQTEKFTRQTLRWNAAARRFEPAAPPVVERRPGA